MTFVSSSHSHGPVSLAAKPRALSALARADIRMVPAVLGVGFAMLYLCTAKGLTGHDDLHYANLANSLSEFRLPLVDYQGPPVFPLRIGLLAPVGLLLGIFGPSEWTLMAYPLLATVAGIVIAWLLLNELFGPRVATLGTLLFGVVPMHLRYATMLLPDLPAGAWAHLGLLLMLRCQRDGRTRYPIATGITAGLALGLSWLHKSTVSFLGPLVLVYLIWCCLRRPASRRAAVALVAAGFSVVAIEAVCYGWVTGDALYRFHATARNFEYNAELFWFVEGGRDGWPAGQYATALGQRLLQTGPRILLASNITVKLALLAIAWAAWRRDRRVAFCAAWLLLMGLLLNVAPTGWDPYRPLVLKKRYLLPLFLPACGLTAYLMIGLARDLRGSSRRCAQLLAVAIGVLIVVSTGPGWISHSRHDPLNQMYHDVLDRIDSSVSPPVLLTDDNTAGCLALLGPTRGGVVQIFDPRHAAPRQGWVLIVPHRLSKLRNDYHEPLPAFLDTWPTSLPADWQRIASWPAGQLFATGARSDP